VGAGNRVLANQLLYDTLEWLRKATGQIDQTTRSKTNLPIAIVARPAVGNFRETWYHLHQLSEGDLPQRATGYFVYEKHFDDTFRDRYHFLETLKQQYPDELQHPVNRPLADLLGQLGGLVSG
jgi:hypothetical protein